MRNFIFCYSWHSMLHSGMDMDWLSSVSASVGNNETAILSAGSRRGICNATDSRIKAATSGQSKGKGKNLCFMGLLKNVAGIIIHKLLPQFFQRIMLKQALIYAKAEFMPKNKITAL